MSNEFPNPDAPVLGKQQFIKYQYQETPMATQGYYYGGGAVDPFAQMQYQQYQPQAVETRRFMGPDISQMQQSQQQFFPQQPVNTQILNRFIEQDRQVPQYQQPAVPMNQQYPQPSPVSPWAQLTAPVGPMNNNNAFMQPFYDEAYLSRPYGNYADASQGLIVPPINKKEMWDPAYATPVVYDSPQINWNNPNPQQAYCYTTPQPQQYVSPFKGASQEQPGSWYARAQENWK